MGLRAAATLFKASFRLSKPTIMQNVIKCQIRSYLLEALPTQNCLTFFSLQLVRKSGKTLNVLYKKANSQRK